MTPGARVQYSAQAFAWRIPAFSKQRLGTLLRIARDGHAVVMWDGRHTAQSLSVGLIEPANLSPTRNEPLPSELAARFAHVEITPDT